MVQLAVLRKVIRNGILTVPFWLALRVKHILHSYTPSSRQPWQTFFGKRLCETFLKTSLPSLFFRRETEMWDSSPSQWAKHLSAYPDSVKTRELSENKSDLISLDDFVWSELGAQVNSASRSPPHITSAEYVRIVRWKLKRGKWRPRLQSMADAVDNNEVVAASTKAFAALKKGNLRDALKPFTELKGCGPATASAILAAVDVQVPFMSDELLQEVMGEHKYTVPAYVQLVKKVKEKVEQLSAADSARKWTARDVEQAVFAAQHKGELAGLADRPSYASQAKVSTPKKTSQVKSALSEGKPVKESAAGKKQMISRTRSGGVADGTATGKEEKLNQTGAGTSEKTVAGKKQVNSRPSSGKAAKETSNEKKEGNSRTRSGKVAQESNAEKKQVKSRASLEKTPKANTIIANEEHANTRSTRTRTESSKRTASEPEKPQPSKRARTSPKEQGKTAKPSTRDSKAKKSAEPSAGETPRLTRSNSNVTGPNMEVMAGPRRSMRVKAQTGS